MYWLHTVIPSELEHWTRSVSEVYGVSLTFTFFLA